ncbi:Detected protein of confused Function [Hibiscus syriacus]|uniref:Detected protein of confused Function n=1 Tax=Hibiscus syriacus TaxID=106335 RepID=A0A6A3B0V2_HIBSY|nr:Detected protein of confused Function [Hibiscus syriacus]
MPCLRKINSTSTNIYASRTVLFVRDDGTLKPLAIELSLPDLKGDQYGAVSKVYTPAQNRVEGSIWLLAKTYVAVNDSGIHELITHWLKTRATIEPFVIATNRQLSAVHPIHKLLHPHFLDTMHINELSRAILINAGLAVDDKDSPNGLRLLIEDYPNDEMVQQYPEIQAWWKEVRKQGHGDKKDEPWWPKMQTLEDLIHSCIIIIYSCTIIVWLSSALHAASNFGQYPYAGYPPNRPTITRRFMPEKGTPEYTELESNPDKGQRDSPEWTSDETALAAFKEFGNRLSRIEERIVQRNNDKRFKNRVGLANMSYTFLYPTGEVGITGRGNPNSIAI